MTTDPKKQYYYIEIVSYDTDIGDKMPRSKKIPDSIQTVCSTPLFKDIDVQNINSYLARGGFSVVRYKRGDDILIPRQNDKFVAIVLSGLAQVYKILPGGKKIILSTLVAKNVFGAFTLFSHEDGFVNYITAKSDMKIAYFDRELIENILSKDFTFAKNYLSYLSSRIRFLNTKIENMAADCAADKLAFFIYECCEELGSPFLLPYSMSDLAKLLNIGRASLYRAFNELESKSVIQRSSREIEVLDKDGLTPKRDEHF